MASGLIVDGEFRPAALTLPSLQSAWEYLSRQQAKEKNPHLLDDLRIAQLTLLNVERGQADPWGFAFWSYIGITYPKYLGILAERQAYERSLGPTLADQLQDPAFLTRSILWPDRSTSSRRRVLSCHSSEPVYMKRARHTKEGGVTLGPVIFASRQPTGALVRIKITV
jgi:hypothetical protein